MVSRHFVVTLTPLRLPFSRYCIRYFPAISFVIFPALRSLLFSHITFVIFPPLHSHSLALPFVIFPPLCSSFSRHFVCDFPAVAFVTFLPLPPLPDYCLPFSKPFSRHCHQPITFFIFPPLRSSVVTLPLLHHVRHLPACLPICWSFCHLVSITFVIFLPLPSSLLA